MAGLSAGHILGHTGLSDVDAELEQLAMNSWRSPEWIGDTHLADQLAYFQRHRRPAAAGRDFQRQYDLNPARCQRITVSGFKIARAPRILGAKRYSPTNINRSKVLKFSRFGD
jgi:hypothetical protein